MIVYVVRGNTEHESSWLVSIHATTEGAEAVCVAQTAEADADLAEMNDPSYLIRTGVEPFQQDTFFDVTPMEVQP